MKTLNLIIFLVIISIFSCKKESSINSENPVYPNMRLWAMTFCGTLEYNENSPEKWKEKVLDSLETWDFNVLSSHLGFKEQEPFIGCGNCRKTGDYLDVIVPKNQREKLKNKGFIE